MIRILRRTLSLILIVMGSPYMLAHGLGISVRDARTTFNIPSDGNYLVWARTRDSSTSNN